MKVIEIYGQKGCGFCVRAVEYAEEHELPHLYRDIANAADRADMFKRNPDAKTVPQIFIGDRAIGGFGDLKAFPLPQLQQMIGE